MRDRMIAIVTEDLKYRKRGTEEQKGGCSDIP
jgi:hypothetical protein